MIQFLVNKNGKVVPQSGNQFLCSYQRPLSEAEKWLAQFDLKQAKDVLVLGGGGGYHIELLKLKYPDVFVHIFEFRSEILEHLEDKFRRTRKLALYGIGSSLDSVFYKNMFQFLDEKVPEIMPFRSAWQGMESNYEKLHSAMLMREVTTLAKYLQNSDSQLKFHSSLWDEKKNFLTLKNLVVANTSTGHLDSQVLKYFGELMK
jgi:trans-aconitate methyltransferase